MGFVFVEEGVVVIGLLGFEEALLKKGMRQPQPGDDVAVCCWLVVVVVVADDNDGWDCDDCAPCAAADWACFNQASLLLWSTGQTSAVEDACGCIGCCGSGAAADCACFNHASLLLWSTGQTSALLALFPLELAASLMVKWLLVVVCESLFAPEGISVLPASAKAFLFKNNVSKRSCCSMMMVPW